MSKIMLCVEHATRHTSDAEKTRVSEQRQGAVPVPERLRFGLFHKRKGVLTSVMTDPGGFANSAPNGDLK